MKKASFLRSTAEMRLFSIPVARALGQPILKTQICGQPSISGKNQPPTQRCSAAIALQAVLQLRAGDAEQAGGAGEVAGGAFDGFVEQRVFEVVKR